MLFGRIPQPLTIEEQRMGLKFMAQRNFEREKNGDAGPVVEIELVRVCPFSVLRG